MDELKHSIRKTELDILARYTSKILALTKQFQEKYTPILDKQVDKFQNLLDGLLEIEDDGNLSVHAQYLLMERCSEISQLLNEMVNEHLQGHHVISMCSKRLDQLFHHDLSHLLRNEKNLDDPNYVEHVNRLIFGYLIGLGRIDVGNTFMRESELALEIPNVCNLELIDKIMVPFRNKDYLPAIEWMKENAPDKGDLIFNLQCQHVIRLLETKGKIEALAYSRQLQNYSMNHRDEIAHLMFMVMTYPKEGPHGYFLHPGRWFELEEELSKTLNQFRSPLSRLLTVGVKTIPSLMTMRALLQSSRVGLSMMLPDELPMNCSADEAVHSTFCCPILKTQSTANNPPLRLNCGHVISNEALTKLSQQSRNNRLKCPYCPIESNMGEAQRVHF